MTIAERYKFYNRSQGQDESAAQFAGELRRLATHCNFGSFLEQALRDRFVYSVEVSSTFLQQHIPHYGRLNICG